MVKFFRINDKGSLKKPTLFAIVMIMFTWVATAAILNDSPMFAIFLYPIEYFVVALIFNNSFRIILAKLMHWTRYNTIIASPTNKEDNWTKANKETFKKSGINLYNGD